MHQTAEICLPRKKKVRDSFHSNTFRIFDENIADRLEPDMVYKNHKYATRAKEESELLKTYNVPQPYNAKFIRTNVRFLNAPVVHMETDNTKDEQFKWWATESVSSERPKAPYCTNTTQRADYQPVSTPVTPAKDDKARTCATAIIPTLEPLGQPKTLQERISFIHQYDSRKLHNQPYQGGQQGTFVWTVISRRQDKGPTNQLHVTSAPVETKAKGPHSPQPCPPSSSSSSSPSSSSSRPTSRQAGGSSGGAGREEVASGGRAEAAGLGQGGEATEGARPLMGGGQSS